MKFVTKMFALAVALAVLTLASATALAEVGSAAVEEGQSYTTEQMLTYAIQDEYMALAEYQAIEAQFGSSRPFSSLITAEERHIGLLKQLFEKYGIALPENDAAGRIVLPDTLTLAYEAGIQAETNNIAMYDTFLNQQNLPEDIQAVFASLKAASENHLSAFEQNADWAGNARLGSPMSGGNGRGNGRDNGRGNGRNNNPRNNQNGNGNCGDCVNCPLYPAA